MRVRDPQSLRNWLKVYFVMGSMNCRKPPAEVLKEAIQGGITLFQYREKGKGSLHGEKKLMLGRELMHLCRQNDIPFIVNDDVDLAISLNADGVHIGQEDEPVEQVRQKIGDKILGVSVHTHQEAVAAINAGADYLGLGPIFPTQTKEDAKPVQGISLIQELRKREFTIPLAGIGGISANNAKMVMEAGADGIAVITAISEAESIAESAKILIASVSL
jgi:thiamine-phosphate pyrophosphorylase